MMRERIHKQKKYREEIRFTFQGGEEPDVNRQEEWLALSKSTHLLLNYKEGRGLC